MHRQIIYHCSFLLTFAVFLTRGADPVITYNCTASKITRVTVEGVSYDNIKVVSDDGSYCLRSKDGQAGLTECIDKHVKPGNLQLIYEGETNAKLDAGKEVYHYVLSCDEISEIKQATLKILNQFGATNAPAWTTLNANQQSGVLELTIDPNTGLYVGQPIHLIMKIPGRKYAISPRECYAHHTDGTDSIKIWECIDTVVDPNIIDQTVWQSVTEEKDDTAVSIPMYAFKFVDSVNLVIECSALVCKDHDQCILNKCASTTTTTTPSPTVRRKRRDEHPSNDIIDTTIRHASVSLEVQNLAFNKSSGLAYTWYAYLVPAYFMICAKLLL